MSIMTKPSPFCTSITPLAADSLDDNLYGVFVKQPE
jgi:hypothetical protein